MLGEVSEMFNRSLSWLEKTVCPGFATFVAVFATTPFDFSVACDIFVLALDFVTVKVSDIFVFVEDLFGLFQYSVEKQNLF